MAKKKTKIPDKWPVIVEGMVLHNLKFKDACRRAKYPESFVQSRAYSAIKNDVRFCTLLRAARAEARKTSELSIDWWRKEQKKVYEMSIKAKDRTQANVAIKSLGQHLGVFERDNLQRAEGLASALASALKGKE
jgi:hypothetical protein